MSRRYLKRLYFDSLCYHVPAMECTSRLIDPSQMMFGTDHPFFPPHVDEEVVRSCDVAMEQSRRR